MPGPRVALLLPPAEVFVPAQFPQGLRIALGRADRLEAASEGRRSQVRRYLKLVPAHWPIAALSRKQDCGQADAEISSWLRADPVHVRPDINGARLLGWGEALELTMDETLPLIDALRPTFGESGMPIDAPRPDHWYLRLPPEAKFPDASDPFEALGTDLGQAIDTSPEGRRWRALVGEAQIILHNHPVNAARRTRGLPAVNSLWLWGGGKLPYQIETAGWQIASRDESVHVLARAATCRAPMQASWQVPTADAAIDLHRIAMPQSLIGEWVMPALEALMAGKLSTLVVDFADGKRWQLQRQQRWRLFRAALDTLA